MTKSPLQNYNKKAVLPKSAREGGTILPTTEQGLMCLILCQSLTDFYRSVEILRLDERTGNIYIFAGEELQIEVYRNGRWIFLI